MSLLTTRSAGRRGGFTLPEVVLSSAIMASALAIFITSFTFAAKCVFDARNEFLTMNYAREQVENRRKFHYRDPDLNVGTYEYTSPVYRATVAIASNGAMKLKTVAVSVVWTNYTLRTAATCRYESIISDAAH